MVPGMGALPGRPGTDQFNKMAVIERWREANAAPESDHRGARHWQQRGMTRPLCPYPQVAVYKGVGSHQ